MAKGSTNGVIRGKKGNTVFYKIKNSNNKEKQGWREYTAEVANPQTDGQIDQRVKMAAVNNLYRALKSIIQRGWENHKYGDESRRAFLKRALSASFNGPYIEKGSTLAVPIEGVPITYGSLPPVVVDCPGGGSMPVLMSVLTASISNITYMSNISSAFISSGMAQAGDQVTFVLGWIPDTADNVVYKEISFIVDPNDGRSTDTAIGVTFTTTTFEDEERLAISDFSGFAYSGFDYCFLCSVSRNGTTANLRSYAEFAMTASFRAKFYGNAEQNAAAKRSYRKQLSADTNWPLVPDSDVGPLYGFTAKRGDGTVIVPRAVTINEAGYTIVEDSQSNLLYVKGTDVRSVSYNRWLKAKNGTVLSDVWNQTAPAELESDQYISFVASDTATADDISFYNFLLAAGYDSRALMGVLPQT